MGNTKYALEMKDKKLKRLEGEMKENNLVVGDDDKDLDHFYNGRGFPETTDKTKILHKCQDILDGIGALEGGIKILQQMITEFSGVGGVVGKWKHNIHIKRKAVERLWQRYDREVEKL
jgi:hypothetical protein